jgi:ubiquinone biosynthesis protein
LPGRKAIFDRNGKRKMKISPNHLKRYKEIAQLFWKYGRSDLVQQMGIEDAAEPPKNPDSGGQATPEQLTDDLEAMGPTYVKLGQVLSSRPVYCRNLI